MKDLRNELDVVVSTDGGEPLAFYAKGHYDPSAFIDGIRLAFSHDYDLDPDDINIAAVRREFWRRIPIRNGTPAGLDCKFIQSQQGRGAFAVTVVDIQGWVR